MSEPPSPAGDRPDPRALLRNRSYVALVVLGGAVGAPIAAVAYFFLKGDRRGAALSVRHASGRSRFQHTADLVAVAPPGGWRACGRLGHPLPARHRGTQAGGGLQARRNPAHRAAGRVHRRGRHPRLRRRARSRGSADRDRQRPWGAGRASAQARCAPAGRHGDRGRPAASPRSVRCSARRSSAPSF